MNNMNPLEKQLQSWVPRRPSEELKRRIFAAPPGAERHTTVASHESAGLPLWMKCAPACCILLLILFSGMERRPKPGYLAVASGSNALASLSSNLLALCATDLSAQRQNVWAAMTFDWTKAGYSHSTISSFPSGNTNVQKL